MTTCTGRRDMPDLDQLFASTERQSERPPVITYQGTIDNDLGSNGDDLFVVIETFDKHKPFGPCRYTPFEGSMPQEGDDCLVTFDNDEQPWIIGWWPYV